MADDTDGGNVFESLARDRAKVEEERARREGKPVVVDEVKPVYEADVVDDADATDSTETTTLEQTVDRTEDRFEETAEKVVEGFKGLGRKLGQGYRKTAGAVRDAHLGEKVKDRAGKIVQGVTDAHLGEKAKTTAGKVAEGVGTVAGAVKSGTQTGAGKFRDAKDKMRGIANPEKQLATLKELTDLVMLYDPGTGKNPALRTAGGVASSVLVVGNTLEENKQLINDLVAYVEGRAGELEYPLVKINEFADFEAYMAEHAGGFGQGCRIVRLNSSYFVKRSNMKSNNNLLQLFRATADPKGIAIILAEDIDLLYSQTGDRTEILNSNARVTGLRRVVEQQAQKGNYKGNWLLVCTTADEDALPDDVEKIVKMEL